MQSNRVTRTTCKADRGVDEESESGTRASRNTTSERDQGKQADRGVDEEPELALVASQNATSENLRASSASRDRGDDVTWEKTPVGGQYCEFWDQDEPQIDSEAPASTSDMQDQVSTIMTLPRTLVTSRVDIGALLSSPTD